MISINNDPRWVGGRGAEKEVSSVVCPLYQNTKAGKDCDSHTLVQVMKTLKEPAGGNQVTHQVLSGGLYGTID